MNVASRQIRNRRTELLAASPPSALTALADECLAGADDPEVLLAPEVGTVVLTVREPVEATRFQLGDVLVTRAEVVHRGQRAWAMRLGADRAATLAAAICDAESEADGPRATAVADLCAATEASQAARRQLEWDELQSTIVRFEEMQA